MARSTESAFVFIHIDEMDDFLRGLSPRFKEMQMQGGALATQERLFGLPLRHHSDVYGVATRLRTENPAKKHQKA